MLYIKTKLQSLFRGGIVLPVRRCSGFTLLEMLITFAIIGVLALAASSYNVESSRAKKAFINIYKILQEQLGDLRYEALTRGTTIRTVINTGGGVMTITSYYAATPTTDCSSAGVWNVLSIKNLDIPSKYGISGTGMDNSCFYRDGTSSGGDFVIAPLIAEEGLKTATITLTISTGYLDVVVEE